MDNAASPCDAMGIGFVADIDHMGLSAAVEMRKFAHCRAIPFLSLRMSSTRIQNMAELETQPRYHSSMKFMYPILLLATLSPAVHADVNLPELGDVSATVLSPLQEQRIAEQIMRDVYNSNQVLQDAE